MLKRLLFRHNKIHQTMKRYITILFIFAFLIVKINAQKHRISIQAGYGTYSLSEIKSFQQDALSSYFPLKIASVDKFPNYINYSVTAEMYVNKSNLIGFNYAYFFTGGRNYMKDYSGEYSLKMPLNATRLGLNYKHIVTNNGKLKSYLQLKQGLVFSKFQTIEDISINNLDSVSNTWKDYSSTFFIEPSYGVSFYLGGGLSLDSSLGFEFDINSRHITKSESYVFWSGLRFLFGIAYDF